MSRPLRLEFPDALYHVTSRGDRRENIFEDGMDREQFLSVFADVIKRFNWCCYAYCLMDNHYHLLIQTPDGNLSKGMRQLNGVYTQSYNRRHNKVGHLFQGRYKGILVDEDAYLLTVCRYIVLNPVKAKMVKRAGDWPWSSFQATAGEVTTPDWLSSDRILSQFSKQRKTAIRKYREYVEAGRTLGPIWSELRNQIYLGDDAFIENMQKYLKESKSDLQIPKTQRRAIPRPLSEYTSSDVSRDEAIVKAYASGGYSYQQLGDYFELHFTTIGKIIRRNKNGMV